MLRFDLIILNFEFIILNFEFIILNCFFLAGSSNGRTTPFGGVRRGSNPLPAAN